MCVSETLSGDMSFEERKRKPLTVVTFGQDVLDNNNQLLTLNKK